jgi:hypothetical protein
VAAPTSCCYCIIPCPCPSGKNPRAPQVTHLLDGKSLASLGFTFNQLSHVLSIVLLLTCTPLVDQVQPCLGVKELLRTDGPSVACFLLTACYAPSLPRGPLRRLSTSPSGTQAPCGLGNLMYRLTAKNEER